MNERREVGTHERLFCGFGAAKHWDKPGYMGLIKQDGQWKWRKVTTGAVLDEAYGVTDLDVINAAKGWKGCAGHTCDCGMSFQNEQRAKSEQRSMYDGQRKKEAKRDSNHQHCR